MHACAAGYIRYELAERETVKRQQARYIPRASAPPLPRRERDLRRSVKSQPPSVSLSLSLFLSSFRDYILSLSLRVPGEPGRACVMV